MSDNSRIARAIVSRGDKSWLVSTINRDFSGSEYVGTYAETMVWEYDDVLWRMGPLAWQGEASRDSLRTHLDVIRRLTETGDPRTDAEKEES